MDGTTPAGESWDFGQPVAGYAWRVPAPRANLLLHHGYGEYAERFVESYSRLIPTLNAKGFSVFAYDAEGHGRSPGPRGSMDMMKAVAIHQAARKALADADEPLFLMGHSLGGLVTAASVSDAPDGAAGVVLTNPALEIELSPVLKVIAGVVAAVAPHARLTPQLENDAISRDPEVIAAYDADPMVINEAPTARVGTTALRLIKKAWAQFPDWTVPVLVLHGDADRIVPVEGSRRFFDTIASADKKLEVFEGGYHELLNDLERERALAAIISWLDARTG
ncbi:alpha/beta hydrolase [Henriciella aquimarina]|uniref:alpha/beta hydrolase n=1 Tax=Henriciella aquimarina TaxID=545261 RepID=UPI0009FC4D99|nr:alpha/beta hydrolase [Henriciella aquimarina]